MATIPLISSGSDSGAHYLNACDRLFRHWRLQLSRTNRPAIVIVSFLFLKTKGYLSLKIVLRLWGKNIVLTFIIFKTTTTKGQTSKPTIDFHRKWNQKELWDIREQYLAKFNQNSSISSAHASAREYHPTPFWRLVCKKVEIKHQKAQKSGRPPEKAKWKTFLVRISMGRKREWASFCCPIFSEGRGWLYTG